MADGGCQQFWISDDDDDDESNGRCDARERNRVWGWIVIVANTNMI